MTKLELKRKIDEMFDKIDVLTSQNLNKIVYEIEDCKEKLLKQETDDKYFRMQKEEDDIKTAWFDDAIEQIKLNPKEIYDKIESGDNDFIEKCIEVLRRMYLEDTDIRAECFDSNYKGSFSTIPCHLDECYYRRKSDRLSELSEYYEFRFMDFKLCDEDYENFEKDGFSEKYFEIQDQIFGEFKSHCLDLYLASVSDNEEEGDDKKKDIKE